MTSIALYIEGGGDSAAGKAALRQGFDTLLRAQKDAAVKRKLKWKAVLCGGRDKTFAAFANASSKRTSDIVVLVVDAEEEVADATPNGRVIHLKRRDRWDFKDFDAQHVHLMTECMEAWIVADPEKLGEFDGQRFHPKALPNRQVLDEESKANLYSALKAATKDTQTGGYGKLKHASELLKRVRPSVVTDRCASVRHLTQWLDHAIASA